MKTEPDYKKIVENIEKWVNDEMQKRYDEGIKNDYTFAKYCRSVKDLEKIQNFLAGDDY